MDDDYEDDDRDEREDDEMENENSTDHKIALDVMTIALNKPEAIETIAAAFGSSKDPVQIVSGIIASVMEASVDQLESRGIGLDPNIWLQEDGVVEDVIDEIDRIANMEGFDIPDDQKVAIWEGVVQNLMAQFEAQQSGGQGQQPAGPPPTPQMAGGMA